MKQEQGQTWEQSFEKLIGNKGEYGFINGSGEHFKFWYKGSDGELITRNSYEYSSAEDLVSSLNII